MGMVSYYNRGRTNLMGLFPEASVAALVPSRGLPGWGFSSGFT